MTLSIAKPNLTFTQAYKDIPPYKRNVLLQKIEILLRDLHSISCWVRRMVPEPNGTMDAAHLR